MEFIQQNNMTLCSDDISIHFVSTSLPRIVGALLKRGWVALLSVLLFYRPTLISAAKTGYYVFVFFIFLVFNWRARQGHGSRDGRACLPIFAQHSDLHCALP